MSGSPPPPTASGPHGHLPFALLLAAMVPAIIGFVWQQGIASIGDDSVSYLVLARYLSPFGSEGHVAPWVPYHSHFPPLLPLILALTGGDRSLLAAHLLIGACAIAAFVLLYLYGARRLGSAGAGAALAVVFAASPTAWISIKGILSEPLYLALSLAALLYHDARLSTGAPSFREPLVFGCLLALACLARATGVVLVIAYAVFLAIRSWRAHRWPGWRELLPLVPVSLAALAWSALRPRAGEDIYAHTTATVIRLWSEDPARLFEASADFLTSGWIATFSADADVGAVAKVLALTVGAAGLLGALLAAWQNRLEGWYVMGSTALVFVWVFPEDNMRRLMYPLVPLVLALAAGLVLQLTARLPLLRRRRALLAAAAAIPLLVSLPAAVLLLHKALDREPVLPGSAHRYADVTDYYTTLNISRARALAARHIAVIAGLEEVASVTPPNARVMWVRPEYVALLGKREAVPWYHGQDGARLAGAIEQAGVDYVIVANLFKTDVHGGADDPLRASDVAAYARPVLVVPNAVVGTSDFILMQIDRRRLAAAVGAAG